jgi:hypothetical protein
MKLGGNAKIENDTHTHTKDTVSVGVVEKKITGNSYDL